MSEYDPITRPRRIVDLRRFTNGCAHANEFKSDRCGQDIVSVWWVPIDKRDPTKMRLVPVCAKHDRLMCEVFRCPDPLLDQKGES